MMCCEEQDLDEIRERYYRAESVVAYEEVFGEEVDDEDWDEEWDDGDPWDHTCPYCGGYLGGDCICADGDEDWYKSLSPIRRLAEDVLRRIQNLRWRITWKVEEWWRENVRREELPF
jgi:hypothetical protein